MVDKRRVKKERRKKKVIRNAYKKLIMGRGRPTKMERAITRGKIRSITIKDLLNERDGELNKNYRRLFKPLVRSEKLLNLLSEQQNINKLRQWFEIKGRFVSVGGDTIVTFGKGSGGDLQGLKALLAGKVWKGKRVDSAGMFIGSGYVSRLVKADSVARVEVKLIFRS